MDLSFIRRNLRSFLGITESLSPLASLPTASLGGSPPEVRLVRPAQVVAATAPATPVAARPPVRTVASPAHDTFKLYEEQLRLDFDLESKLALAATPDAHRQIRAAFAQFRASKLRGKSLADIAKEPFALRPAGKAAPAPALEDDNQTATPPASADPENPAGIDSIISQLLDLVLELKKQVQVTGTDDAETQAALGLFGAGKKLSASRALMAVTKKMCERPKLTPAQKISRGFSAQSGVQAIQACLRPGPRQCPAPAASTSPTVPAAVTSPSGYRDRAHAIRAEIESLNVQMHKSGIYDNRTLAKQSQLKAELHRLIKANRPQ